jgi:carboxypeptidase Taq
LDAPPAYEELQLRLSEVHDLGKAAALAAWDQRTQMPTAGAPARAELLGTVSRVAHERFASDEVGALLKELESFEESLEFDSYEASLIRRSTSTSGSRFRTSRTAASRTCTGREV